MIEVEHLTKRFRSATAVDDLSFSVPRGRITGRVFDASTNLMSNIRVAIPVQDGFFWVKANEDGRYNFDNLALADYEAAIKLNPRFGRAYVLRGLLLLKRGGQDAAAWKDLNQGFELDPSLHAEFDPMIKQLRPNE